MAFIKDGPIRRVVDLQQEFIQHFASGLAPTDGVAYTSAVTFGTGATEILNQLIDPGYGMYLKDIQVGLTQKFTNVGSGVGTLGYHWKARSEYTDPRGSKHTEAYYAFTATYQKGIASGSNSEDTFSNYLPASSIPAAPLRVILTATGDVNDRLTGQIKNSSFVRLMGIVIPGT